VFDLAVLKELKEEDMMQRLTSIHL
jgi:hypothetical protein